MIVSRTPLRLSFAGGGTDFPEFYLTEPEGGCVVSTTIDKYLYVSLKKSFDDRIRVNYSRTEIVDDVAEIQHDLVRTTLRWTGIKRGVEIATMADIPSEGSGLGSSSTMVGLLAAMYAYLREDAAPVRLASDAYYLERVVLGRPVGCQDPYIAAFGGLCFMHFGPDRRVSVTTIAVGTGELEQRLLLFYTGLTRRAEDILQEQQENVPLRGDLLREMRQQARDLRGFLLEGECDGIGPLLDRGWHLKRKLASRISSPEIDALYERARAAGATGGKLAGAGGGGFLLLYCPPEREHDLRQALHDLKELPFRFERRGSCVLLNDQAGDEHG